MKTLTSMSESQRLIFGSFIFFLSGIMSSSITSGTEVSCKLALCRAAGRDCETNWLSFEPNHPLTVNFPGYIDRNDEFQHAKNPGEDKGSMHVVQERETRETLATWASPLGEIAKAILEMKPSEPNKSPRIRFISAIKPTGSDVLQFSDSLISEPVELGDFQTDAGERRLVEAWAKHNNAAYERVNEQTAGESPQGSQLVIVIQDSEGLRGVPITPEEFRIAQNVAYNLQRLHDHEGSRIPPNKVYLMKVTEDPTTGEELIFMADPANEPI